MKYNQLEVVQEVIKNGRRMYEVRCDCGRVETKRKDHVVSGRAQSCKSCASKRTAAQYPPPVSRRGFEGLSGTHYNSIKHGAVRRGIEFDVSEEYLWNLYISQAGKCALTGVEIILECAIKQNSVDWGLITASLDRKDSSKGYVEGNVWWVHKTANRLKNNYSMDELLYWCKLIVSKHGNPEPSVSNSE